MHFVKKWISIGFFLFAWLFSLWRMLIQKNWNKEKTENKDEREKARRRATKGKEGKEKGREYQKGEENEQMKMNE